MKVIDLAREVRNGDFLRVLYNRFKDREDVVLEIVKNPATPVDVLSDISGLSEDFIDTAVYKFIAKEGSRPEVLIEVYFHFKNDPEIIRLLKANPYTPGDVQVKIVLDEEDFDTSLYEWFAEKCPIPEILRELYYLFKNNPEIRKLLKSNPYPPEDVKASIASDEL